MTGDAAETEKRMVKMREESGENANVLVTCIIEGRNVGSSFARPKN